MKKFILGLAVGIAMTASYFLLTGDNKRSQAALDSQNESAAEFEQLRTDSASKALASEISAERENQDTGTENIVSDVGSAVQPSKDIASGQKKSKYTESQFYLDEYDRELRARIDTISERLNLSKPQWLKLEKKLLQQKEDLAEKVGEEYLDHIMINEFSVGFEEDLTESQIEEFASYKHEKAMYAATIVSEALVAGIKESTGISEERANELEHALNGVHYNNRMSGEFTNAFSVIEEFLTSEEWEAYRTGKK